MSYISMKGFNPDSLLNGNNINTSRQGLCYYEEEQTARILNTGTLTFVENRKFKLDIENKFKACRANQTYSFPLRATNEPDDVEQDREMYQELSKVRFYNLNEQNERPCLTKHRRSRSESTIRLFHKMIEQEKQDTKKRDETAERRVAQKDKENNLNFHNLLVKVKEKEQPSPMSNTQSFQQPARMQCKPTLQPKNMSGLNNRTCVPKINLPKDPPLVRAASPSLKSPAQHKEPSSSIRCFRDLFKCGDPRK